MAVVWAAVGWCERRPGRLGGRPGWCWRCCAGGGRRRAAGWAWRHDPWWVSESSALAGGSAAQRQGTQPGERPGELDGPGPGALQAKDRAAGVADDRGRRHGAAGSAGSWARRRARAPSSSSAWVQHGEVLGGKDQLQPDAVAPPPVEGEVVQAGGLGGADAVLDPGALAVPQLQPSQVGVGLVGQEDLEAVPVKVAEAQLGAGVGVLAAADRPRAPAARCAGRPSRSARPPQRQRGAGRRGRPPGSRRARVGPGSPRGGGRRSASPPRTPHPGRAGARRAGCWPQRCRCGPGPAGQLRTWGAGPGPGRPTRPGHRQRPAAALPGRRMPASGSPGAWPRSR